MTNSKILSKLPADSKNTIINGPLVNVLDAKYVCHIMNENHDKRPMLIPDSIKPHFKDILEGWLHKHSQILVDENVDTIASIKKKEATNRYKGEKMDISNMKRNSPVLSVLKSLPPRKIYGLTIKTVMAWLPTALNVQNISLAESTCGITE